MLINLSNHPFSTWSKDHQKTAIRQFGEVKDISFPSISPTASKSSLLPLVRQYQEMIYAFQQAHKEPITVHIMGELTFCYALVSALQDIAVPCVASTSYRSVRQEGSEQVSRFEFVRFRAY